MPDAGYDRAIQSTAALSPRSRSGIPGAALRSAPSRMLVASPAAGYFTNPTMRAARTPASSPGNLAASTRAAPTDTTGDRAQASSISS